MSTQTSITLGAVNMEADDPATLARFWAEALGSTIVNDDPDYAVLTAREPDGVPMMIMRRSEPRPERQSQHMDLTVPWGTREAEVARLVNLGATLKWEILDEIPWVQWSTLTDPEGNLFCVAEHPPQG
ncbi:VOC family protein [Pseudactinotalea sp.]|uniref:VOC family protein n=1 Tax=Pseudactinotalea sp. TaxID=1926260 RepID=UPI003B3BAC79